MGNSRIPSQVEQAIQTLPERLRQDARMLFDDWEHGWHPGLTSPWVWFGRVLTGISASTGAPIGIMAGLLFLFAILGKVEPWMLSVAAIISVSAVLIGLTTLLAVCIVWGSQLLKRQRNRLATHLRARMEGSPHEVRDLHEILRCLRKAWKKFDRDAAAVLDEIDLSRKTAAAK